ncbi:hypothetical protein [Arhodomonas sp. SL1]|uniref:hypothetical protein n=1 Tax=Arhodomonas sp. SL1 TaxID=3425691 RepID=UPI003F885464
MTAPASAALPVSTYRGRFQTQRGHRSVLVAALDHCQVLLDGEARTDTAGAPILGVIRTTLAECQAYAPELRLPETRGEAAPAIARARRRLVEQGADAATPTNWRADFDAWLTFECGRGSDNYRHGEVKGETGPLLDERARATILMTGLVHADACAQLAEGETAEYAALVLCRSALKACRDYCAGLRHPMNLTEARQLLNKAADQLIAAGVPANGFPDAERSTAEWLRVSLGEDCERIAPESLAGGVLSVLPASPAFTRAHRVFSTPSRPGPASAARRGPGEGTERRPVPGL